MEKEDLKSAVKLTDDVLLHLAKDYLSEKDCLALALSGVFDRFPILYADKRKKLVISRLYFISPNNWTTFFQQYISPLTIIVLDASHCYWLPAQLLLDSILPMENLEELYIHDTQLSLSFLPKVFETCQKIVKLSFTLTEKTLNTYWAADMEEKLDWMRKGFGRLTDLKMSTFAQLDDNYYIDSWLVTVGVLTWCRDCVHLTINIAYIYFSLSPEITEKKNDRALATAQSDLFPHLEWMKELKSLVILRRGCRSCPKDVFVSEFLAWLMREQPPNKLEQLWIDEQSFRFDELEENFITSPSLNAFALFGMGALRFNLNGDRFRHLERLGESLLRQFDHLKDLKYISGQCVPNNQDLDDFCQSHSELEHLHLDTTGYFYSVEDCRCFNNRGADWSLLSLKVLVYRSIKLCQTFVERVVEACPNLKEFHVGVRNGNFFHKSNHPRSLDFFLAIRFQHLTRISINGFHLFDGSYLPSIFEKCPKLECLHMEGDMESGKFFSHLSECLPKASKLRDLRLEWNYRTGDAPHVPLLLKALLKCSTHFERLVLIDKDNGCELHPNNPFEQLNSLLSFVSKMTHLVALCLVGFQIDRKVVEVIKQRLTDEILPDRPAFWFHVGPELPKGNDLSVPRVHYDEVINPIDAYYAPPKF